MQRETKGRMLYVMGIDWDWIYQRPQILAEYLSRDYEVTVVYPVKAWERYSRNKKRDKAIRYRRLWTLPFQRKLKIIGWAADRYGSLLLRACRQYEYVYIDYPVYIKYIPADYRGCLIYDCIDDHAQMCAGAALRQEVERTEREAVLRSSLLMASSAKLLRKLEEQSRGRRVTLIRNGTDFTKPCATKESRVKEQYTLGYIGTIAEWFDEALLERSVREHPELSYHLIGPSTGAGRKAHERIIYDGVVEHGALRQYIEEYDCLVMPFVVNEIVKSVDPVKLYDYIAFGKCIISVWYEELEHFKDFVYFYSTYEEYDRLIDELAAKGFPPKYNARRQVDFLRENSWQERYRLVAEAIRLAEEERQSVYEGNERVRDKTGSNQDVSVGEGVGRKSGGRERRMPDGAASGNA